MIKLHEVLHIFNFCIYSFLGWQISPIKQIRLKSMGSCYYRGKAGFKLLGWSHLQSKIKQREKLRRATLSTVTPFYSPKSV